MVLTPARSPVATVDPAAAEDNLRPRYLESRPGAINAVVIVPTVVVETGPRDSPSRRGGLALGD
ncbi:MAG: hypothetical protein U1F11_02735 [Steroidobacteraceae bacterium]